MKKGSPDACEKSRIAQALERGFVGTGGSHNELGHLAPRSVPRLAVLHVREGGETGR
jgi:hypothetical protein